jgi:death-on-curing protein
MFRCQARSLAGVPSPRAEGRGDPHQVVHGERDGDAHPGLRDRGLLESAMAMPRSTFGGVGLHVGLPEKAAASNFHPGANQPFMDGNKRVAVAAAEVFLLINGQELSANDNDVEELTRGVAAGRLSKDHVIEFFVRGVEICLAERWRRRIGLVAPGPHASQR